MNLRSLLYNVKQDQYWFQTNHVETLSNCHMYDQYFKI